LWFESLLDAAGRAKDSQALPELEGQLEAEQAE